MSVVHVVDGERLPFRVLSLAEGLRVQALAEIMQTGKPSEIFEAMIEAVVIFSGRPREWCLDHFDMATATKYIHGALEAQVLPPRGRTTQVRRPTGRPN